MSTETISAHALSTIDQYMHFKLGTAVCSVPYFNNKTTRTRGGLRALIGKGSIKDILDEVYTYTIKHHISTDTLSDDALKKILVDMHIGIDCSAFAYYVLNAEYKQLNKGSLYSRIHFTKSTGLIGKIRAKLRPIENCDVATLADDTNSRLITLFDVKAGDMIILQGGPDSTDRDHILVIHSVERRDSIPVQINYSHAIAYPEDGVYGTGIRQGSINIIEANTDIILQTWVENDKRNSELPLFARAQKSKTEIRRLIV